MYLLQVLRIRVDHLADKSERGTDLYSTSICKVSNREFGIFQSIVIKQIALFMENDIKQTMELFLFWINTVEVIVK